MDVYDMISRKIQGFDQKKFFVASIAIAIILIILMVFFLIYVFKSANAGRHLLDPTGKMIENRNRRELEEKEKILEDPEAQRLYEKIFENRDFTMEEQIN